MKAFQQDVYRPFVVPRRGVMMSLPVWSHVLSGGECLVRGGVGPGVGGYDTIPAPREHVF